MTKTEITQHLLASLATVGNIFTDAPECANAVRAAENLIVLSNMLSSVGDGVAQGELVWLGHKVGVTVRVDGTVSVPSGVAALEDVHHLDYDWKLVLSDGVVFDLDAHGNEDEILFVVRDIQSFYKTLLTD